MIASKYPYQVTLYQRTVPGQGSAATPDKHKTAEVIDRWAPFPLRGKILVLPLSHSGRKNGSLNQQTIDQLGSNSD